MKETKEISNFLNTIWDQSKQKIANHLFSIEEKMLLRDHIHKLPKNEMSYIFKIVVSNKENYNKNNNGVFFDLNKLSNSTIEEIYNYIQLIQKTQKEDKVEYIMES